ncbi:MAG: hypothetical protein WCP45_05270 [Verrucomicrobiota bacterium]
MTATSNIRFTSPAAKKQFEIGMGIVRAKLGKAKPTAEERQLAYIAKGKKILAAKLSPNGYRKAFGVPPPVVTAKPITKPARTMAPSAAPAAPASPPAGRRELIRHYSVPRGLF